MKAFKFLVSLLLLLGCFHALRAGTPVQLPGYKESLFSSVELQSKPCKSILFLPNTNEYAKHRETTGWLLLGVGAGALATGSIMLGKGLNDIINAAPATTSENPALNTHAVPYHDVVLISAGGALAFTGLVLTPTGLIMGVTGKARYNKYSDPTPFLITPVCDSYGIGMCSFF